MESYDEKGELVPFFGELGCYASVFPRYHMLPTPSPNSPVFKAGKVNC